MLRLFSHHAPRDPPDLCLSCGNQGCSLCKAPASSCDRQAERRVLVGSKDVGPLVESKVFSSLAPPTEEQSKELARDMPKLAGRPLEPPRFHPTDWRTGQTFTESDDPDRTRLLWEPPTFLQFRDPVLQRSKTSVQELHVPSGEGEFPYSFARIVRGVMDEEDCAELIARVNSKGFTPALINAGGGRQRFLTHARDGHRVIVDCPKLAAWLLEVLKPHLEDHMCGQALLELNERCRILCYTPGQEFPGHYDGCFRKPTGQRSMVTIQLYLHDVPAENGGATTFLWEPCHGQLPCQPAVGSALLFTQDLFHEGSQLKAGLKYTLRTEAMYICRG